MDGISIGIVNNTDNTFLYLIFVLFTHQANAHAKTTEMHVAILVAISPKSNSAYEAINSAWDDISKGKGGPIPRTLQNKHFDGEDAAVKGQFYKYPHAYKNHYVEQQYLPDAIKGAKYYEFGDNKTEQGYKEYDKIRKGK